MIVNERTVKVWYNVAAKRRNSSENNKECKVKDNKAAVRD